MNLARIGLNALVLVLCLAVAKGIFELAELLAEVLS